MICQKRVFLLNNVYFDQKLVSLYSNIRLLERDEWSNTPFSASIELRTFSIKTTKCYKAYKTKNNRTPPLCIKGLVACRDTSRGFFDI